MNIIDKVLSPFRLGNSVSKNRILMSGMHLGMEDEADPFKVMADFFEIRAKADVGMIVVGGCSPDLRGRVLYSKGFCISDDQKIREHKKITSVIKKHGSLPILQLCPFGRESFHGHMFAPSPVKVHSNLYRPKPIFEDEILESIENFGQAVLRTREAGYDAIEIVGSQGFLIHQFLAKRTNQRDDKWGGSIENRSRYAVEVMRRAKQLAGDDFPIIFRLPSLDLVDGGIDEEDFSALTNIIMKEKPALINVGIGWHDSPVPSIAMNVPDAGFAPVARYVKSLVGETPIAVSNRINDLRVAEKLLQGDFADVVAMGRPFLADPDLIIKAKKQYWNRINTCIACNQACLDNALRNQRVGCIVNPLCADLYASGSKARKEKKFSVIGGGVAGMSAALWLRRFGHQVSLYEKQTHLGGQINQAIKIPGKSIFKETLRYFESELYREGVKVFLGKEIELEDIKSFDCDHVLIALGAEPRMPDLPIASDAYVVSYKNVLENRLPLVEPIVIVGSGAIALDMIGYINQERRWLDDAYSYIANNIDESRFRLYKSAAEETPISLLSRSKKTPGSTIGSTTRWINLKKLQNVNFIKQADIKSIQKGSISILDGSNDVETLLPANTVIFAIGQEPLSSLTQSINQCGIPCSEIGVSKAKAVRYSAGEAIKQGYDFAKSMLE
jgi:2,4-dienoyl-CoA reductase (NADPH2)